MTSRAGLDIQQFVGRVDVLRASLWPVLWIYPVICDLINWESPLYSTLTVLCLCTACFFAEHWLPMAFIGLSFLLVCGYVKLKAYESTMDRTQHRGVKDRPRFLDNTAHFLEACHQDVLKTEESIRKFRSLIVQLQQTVLQVIHVAEELRTVLYWHQPKRTLKYLLGFLLVAAISWLVSWRYPLIVIVLWTFTVNGHLFEMVTERLRKLWKKRESPLPNAIRSATPDHNDSIQNRQTPVRQRHPVQHSNESSEDEEISVLDVKLDEDSSDSSDEPLTQNQPTDKVSQNVNPTVNSKVPKSSALSRFLRRRKATPPVGVKPVKPKKLYCFSCNKSVRSSHVCCSSCGDTFCGSCCSNHVSRSSLGATSPAAFEETVAICGACYLSLHRK